MSTKYFVILQTQEREAKAEMRRKAKELQQARRDAERSGKKVPAFGGFGSTGMTSVSSGSIITDTVVEPEKPKITPVPIRYRNTYIQWVGKVFRSRPSFHVML